MVPRVPGFAVTRPRLLDRVDRGVQGLVTVVSGPPGSGKTTLLADYAASGRAPGPVAWLDLEVSDDSPDAFWSYVLGSLAESGLNLDGVAPPLGAADDTGVAHSVLASLATRLSRRETPTVLVLDHVGLVGERTLAPGLDQVVRHARGRLRLVLAVRGEPPLTLHRHRLAGTLTEITARQLALTPSEVGEVLDAHGVQAAPEVVAALAERTEGWVAPVRLLAVDAQGQATPDALARALDKPQGSVDDYLRTVILDAQPPATRDFLLRTGLVETLTPALADALTGRGGGLRVLTELARDGALVVSAAGPPGSFRYHRLLARLLRSQVTYELPGEVDLLHRRAAAWYAEQHRPREAVSHAVRVGDWETAAAVVVDELAVGLLVTSGREGSQLVRLLDPLPEGLPSPDVEVVGAALSLVHGDVVRCGKSLTRAEENLARAWGDTAGLRVAISLLDMLTASAQADVTRTLEAAELTAGLLSDAPRVAVARHPELRALVLAHRGAAQVWAGRLDEAAVTLGAALDATVLADLPDLRLDVLGRLALCEVWRGRYRRAEALAEQAAERASREQPGRRRGVPSPSADVAMAWIALERDDLLTALRHVDAATASATVDDDPAVTTALALVRSALRRPLGGTEANSPLREPRTTTARMCPPWMDDQLALGKARALTADGAAAAALAVLDDLPDRGSPEASLVRASALLAAGDLDAAADLAAAVTEAQPVPAPVGVRAWLVLAAVAARQSHEPAAREALDRARRAAEPESVRRPFGEADPSLRPLIREVADDPASTDAMVVVEPLSRREHEVLQHVAAMLSNEEIADVLFVSVNTIRTHVRSILRKLSASRRSEAVRRARQRGLL